MPRRVEKVFPAWPNLEEGKDAKAWLSEASSALDDTNREEGLREDTAAIGRRIEHPGVAADAFKTNTQAAPDTHSVERHPDADSYLPDFSIQETPQERGLEEGPQGWA